MIGAQLEKAGWRQGSVVGAPAIQQLTDIIDDMPFTKNLMLLVASQSCDIAHNNVDTEPYIELSVARKIEVIEGRLSHNRNPRILHTHLTCRTKDADVYTKENLELRAFERTTLKKEMLAGLRPDPDRVMEDRQLQSYVAWLAARYSRPALPATFNDLIRAADPRGKLRDKAKRGNAQLVGIYVEINPDRELKDGESYLVNLLGLLPAGFAGDSGNAESAINAFADVLQRAGMEVKAATRTEDQISLAVIRRFKRLYYDDLSFREGAPLPVETRNIL